MAFSVPQNNPEAATLANFWHFPQRNQRAQLEKQQQNSNGNRKRQSQGGARLTLKPIARLLALI